MAGLCRLAVTRARRMTVPASLAWFLRVWMSYSLFVRVTIPRFLSMVPGPRLPVSASGFRFSPMPLTTAMLLPRCVHAAGLFRLAVTRARCMTVPASLAWFLRVWMSCSLCVRVTIPRPLGMMPGFRLPVSASGLRFSPMPVTVAMLLPRCMHVAGARRFGVSCLRLAPAWNLLP
jgi:hypothetical protein